VLFIASRHGFMVAFLSLVAGVGGLFAAGALGAPSQAPAIGFLALGGVAWLLGRHEPERNRACSLFFIPLRLYAVVALGIGALFLFVPGRPGTAPARAPEDQKLSTIEARLRNDASSGSSGGAQEKAAEYQKALAAFEKISGIDGKVSVHLDLDTSDLRVVRKACLYVQSFNLKKYSDDAKKSLVELCFKMLKADFPDAALHVAARGPFLWGVRGSLVNGAQVIRVGSESPTFP
jgi:hypothetical protein